MDVKTVGHSAAYDEDRSGRLGKVVLDRSEKVHSEYMASAKKIDRSHDPSLGDQSGPLERKLAGFGQVMGLAFGYFGEASPSVHSLVDSMAKQQSASHARKYGCGIQVAKEIAKKYMRQKLGITLSVGWAELKMKVLSQVFRDLASRHGLGMEVAEELGGPAEENLRIAHDCAGNRRLAWVPTSRG